MRKQSSPKSLHRSRTQSSPVQRVLIVSAEAELLTAPAPPNAINAAIAVVFNAFANMIVSCSCSPTLRWTRWLCFFFCGTDTLLRAPHDGLRIGASLPHPSKLMSDDEERSSAVARHAKATACELLVARGSELRLNCGAGGAAVNSLHRGLMSYGKLIKE